MPLEHCAALAFYNSRINITDMQNIVKRRSMRHMRACWPSLPPADRDPAFSNRIRDGLPGMAIPLGLRSNIRQQPLTAKRE
jgi:hypothetical protein